VTSFAAADLLRLHPLGFDAVLSDMAPATSGSSSADVARSLELANHALVIALGEDLTERHALYHNNNNYYEYGCPSENKSYESPTHSYFVHSEFVNSFIRQFIHS
jgi:hypothetical protein